MDLLKRRRYMMNDVITKKSGTELILVKCKGSLIKDFKVYGQSTQATTTGAQLIDTSNIVGVGGATVTVTDNGASLTVTGFRAYSGLNAVLPIEIMSGRKVTFSCDSGEGTKQIAVTLQDGTKKYYDLANGREITFVVPSDAESAKLSLLVNNTASNLENSKTITFENTMINLGEPLPYEPYTGGIPSPSPDYPQEIKSIGDSGKLDLMVTGTNLFDQETVLPSIGFAKQSDGSFYVENNGTVVNKHIWDNVTGYKGQITLVYNVKYLNNQGAGVYFFVYYTDRTKSVLTKTSDTSNVDKTIDFISCTYGTSTSSTWIQSMAIYLGAISNPVYTPYKSQSIPIPLTEPLRAIANVRDRIALKDGVWGVERNIGETVFKGTEEWIKYENASEGISFFTISSRYSIGFQTSICNMFSNKNSAWNTNYVGKVWIYSDHLENRNKYFRPPNLSITTVEQFKTWLAERYAEGNPVKLVYKLNSVYWTFEPFDQATQSMLNKMSTYTGCTTITNNENASIDVCYRKLK